MSTQQNDNYMTKFNPPDTLTESLIKRLNADIQNGTSYVLNEIEDELKYVFGEDWRKFFGSFTPLLYPKSKGINLETGYFAGNAGIALSLLLLKRGYVYNNGCCLLYSKSAPKSDYQGEFDYTDEHAERACKLIEDEIHRKYPELPESFYIGSAEYELIGMDGYIKKMVGSVIAIVAVALLIVLSIGNSKIAIIFGVIIGLFPCFMGLILLKNRIDVEREQAARLSTKNAMVRALIFESVILIIGVVIAVMCLASGM